jgi:hypothetical protein
MSFEFVNLSAHLLQRVRGPRATMRVPEWNHAWRSSSGWVAPDAVSGHLISVTNDVMTNLYAIGLGFLVTAGCEDPPQRSTAQPQVNPECGNDGDCGDARWCDRGTCAAERPEGNPYGARCFLADVDPATGERDYRGDVCAGYLCIDGRCRSCLETSECSEFSDPVSCETGGRPGKSCGDYSFQAPDATATPP